MSFDINSINPAIRLKIEHYFKGNIDLSELGITRANGKSFLVAIKIFDGLKSFSQNSSSYALRTEILRQCSPELGTNNVYSTILNEAAQNDYCFLKNPKAWLPERVREHIRILWNYFISARNLSQKLDNSPYKIYAVRGNTGAGKTTFLRQFFLENIEEEGLLSGTLNPDKIKANLKRISLLKEGICLTNNQVYTEGTMLFSLLQEAISFQALHLNFIIDSRLTTLDYFDWSVLKPALLRNGEIFFIELDVDLRTSTTRVLVRDPDEEAPCVSLKAILEGYHAIRKARYDFIKFIQENASIAVYKLYYLDEFGKQTLIAKKKANLFKVLDSKLFSKSLTVPKEKKINQILKTIINEEFIDKAISCGDIASNQAVFLKRWRLNTLAHAIGRHSQGDVGKINETTFTPGKIRILRHIKKFFGDSGDLSKIEDEHFCEFVLSILKGQELEVESFLNYLGGTRIPSMMDALSFAAIAGQAKIVNLLLLRGVPIRTQPFDQMEDAYLERLTAIGHAIINKHFHVVETFLEHEIDIKNCFREKTDRSILDLFFERHKTTGPHAELLKLILKQHPVIDNLETMTLFKLGVYASSEELSILINAGFDPKSVQHQEQHPELSRKSYFYIREVSLLDLAVMQAEKANLFKEDQDSINKVALLIQRGADVFSCKNYCQQNYLHQISHPALVRLFTESRVDVKSEAFLQRFWQDQVRPIDLAHTLEAVDILCAFGESKENSPFIKGTRAHLEALFRIGFDPKKGLNQLDEQGELYLIKAYEKRDIAAFIALIGAGVDVNQRKPHIDWTSLHHLFSQINVESVNFDYDYVSQLTDSFEIRLINILIKHGAVPSKDIAGRTPLMCLSLNAKNIPYNQQIIETYIGFEATYYNLDHKHYKEKFEQLREKRFPFNEIYPTRIKAVSNKF